MNEVQSIESKIYEIRGEKVMFDRDLAELYNVETKYLNKAVKRNIERFPERFMFQVTSEELSRFQFGTLKGRGYNIKYLPYVFTEQGVAMLSAILRSDVAVDISIKIMDAFVAVRRYFVNNTPVLTRLDKLEQKLIAYQTETDCKFEKVFNALESKKPENQKVFYNGQIYDAYSLIIEVIKQAEKEIVIIDGYVDNSLLDMLTKKHQGVTVYIYTYPTTRLNDTDVNRFNAQYPILEIKNTTIMHDRFVIIDRMKLYHIGASLKDLGKKCFALSLIEDHSIINDLLARLTSGCNV